jgi:hypothetical protein
MRNEKSDKKNIIRRIKRKFFCDRKSITREIERHRKSIELGTERNYMHTERER